MHKWIMAVVFFGACAFALVALFLEMPGQTEVAKEPTAPFALPAVTYDADAAAVIYKNSCIACHGTDLEGGMGPKLSDAGTKFTPEEIFKQIANGGGGMPPFKDSLKDTEIANLTLWLGEHK